MNFPVAEATHPYTLEEVPIWPDDLEFLVAKVLDRLPAAGDYGPDDRRLAADLVRFSVMTLDLLEFAYTAQEKREALLKINRSLGDRLEWLYTALIAAVKELPEGFDEAEKSRIIGAFLSVCTLTHDVIATPLNRTWQAN